MLKQEVMSMKLHRMLGKNIRFWREARGFTQEELAFRAQTSSSYISKMELGKENPTITVLERIAKALAIDPCMLLLNTCRCAENAKKKQICDQQPVASVVFRCLKQHTVKHCVCIPLGASFTAAVYMK